MADEMSKEEGQQAVADLLAAYQLQINDALTQAVKRGLKVDARIKMGAFSRRASRLSFDM